MSNDNFEKTIRLVPFDGTAEDWAEWKEKFYAQAVDKGFDELLDGDIDAPDDNISAPSVSQRNLIKLNKKAYSLLILSLKGIPFGIVKNAKNLLLGYR